MIPPLSPVDLRSASDTLRRWLRGVDTFLRGLGSAAQLSAETSLTSGSDQAVPTVKAVKAYVDGLAAGAVTQSSVTVITSNADFTLTVLVSTEEILHSGALTADRTITLSTTDAYNGARFRVARTVSTSSYLLRVGTVCDLGPKSWCEVLYNGSSWYVAAAGDLPA